MAYAPAPSAPEIETMARLTEEALRAGALGFTTSRTTKHKAKDGRFTPSLSAREAELLGIAVEKARVWLDRLDDASVRTPLEAASASGMDRSPLRTVQFPRGFDAAVLERLLADGAADFDELGAALSVGTPLTLVEGDTDTMSFDLPADSAFLAAVIAGR